MAPKAKARAATAKAAAAPKAKANASKDTAKKGVEDAAKKAEDAAKIKAEGSKPKAFFEDTADDKPVVLGSSLIAQGTSAFDASVHPYSHHAPPLAAKKLQTQSSSKLFAPNGSPLSSSSSPRPGGDHRSGSPADRRLIHSPSGSPGGYNSSPRSSPGSPSSKNLQQQGPPPTRVKLSDVLRFCFPEVRKSEEHRLFREKLAEENRARKRLAAAQEVAALDDDAALEDGGGRGSLSPRVGTKFQPAVGGFSSPRGESPNSPPGGYRNPSGAVAGGREAQGGTLDAKNTQSFLGRRSEGVAVCSSSSKNLTLGAAASKPEHSTSGAEVKKTPLVHSGGNGAVHSSGQWQHPLESPIGRLECLALFGPLGPDGSLYTSVCVPATGVRSLARARERGRRKTLALLQMPGFEEEEEEGLEKFEALTLKEAVRNVVDSPRRYLGAEEAHRDGKLITSRKGGREKSTAEKSTENSSSPASSRSSSTSSSEGGEIDIFAFDAATKNATKKKSRRKIGVQVADGEGEVVTVNKYDALLLSPRSKQKRKHESEFFPAEYYQSVEKMHDKRLLTDSDLQGLHLFVPGTEEESALRSSKGGGGAEKNPEAHKKKMLSPRGIISPTASSPRKEENSLLASPQKASPKKARAMLASSAAGASAAAAAVGSSTQGYEDFEREEALAAARHEHGKRLRLLQDLELDDARYLSWQQRSMCLSMFAASGGNGMMNNMPGLVLGHNSSNNQTGNNSHHSDLLAVGAASREQPLTVQKRKVTAQEILTMYTELHRARWRRRLPARPEIEDLVFLTLGVIGQTDAQREAASHAEFSAGVVSASEVAVRGGKLRFDLISPGPGLVLVPAALPGNRSAEAGNDGSTKSKPPPRAPGAAAKSGNYDVNNNVTSSINGNTAHLSTLGGGATNLTTMNRRMTRLTNIAAGGGNNNFGGNNLQQLLQGGSTSAGRKISNKSGCVYSKRDILKLILPCQSKESELWDLDEWERNSSGPNKEIYVNFDRLQKAVVRDMAVRFSKAEYFSKRVMDPTTNLAEPSEGVQWVKVASTPPDPPPPSIMKIIDERVDDEGQYMVLPLAGRAKRSRARSRSNSPRRKKKEPTVKLPNIRQNTGTGTTNWWAV